tara:strand:+ start:969 stop:1184 length:216 start_codon:yes stop_codon:yes gene_type:complete
MQKHDVYEMVDQTGKKDENCLTVDFYFESDVIKDEAVSQINLLAMLADNNDKFTFISHRPAIFTKSRWADE